MRIEIGMRADGRDKASGEVAPEAEVCGQRRPDFAGAEFEQPVTRAMSERAFERAIARGFWLGGLVGT